MEKMAQNGEVGNACGSIIEATGEGAPVKAGSKPRDLVFWVDEICIIAFPASFTVFIILYMFYCAWFHTPNAHTGTLFNKRLAHILFTFSSSFVWIGEIF